ncbi:MAG: PDDEXK nuclease domain-containing protein [Verrucomicrobiales bacterium]|nr:PDDEXK nuclease domain-containing protein [Verrucomicrobiales bacterium]
MSELSENSDFFSEVKNILSQARASAVRSVNSVMVDAYWTIGQRIVEEEQGGSARAQYGKRLLEELSHQLSDDFGSGFSVANLRNMRQFYQSCPEKGIRYTLSSELSWSHNCLIMREDSDEARLYYLKESKAQNWSVRELKRQIRTQTYQRLLSTQQDRDIETSTELTSRERILSQLKDPYLLEFLNLKAEPHLQERELETALINDLQKFLLELGGGFSFVDRQMRISTETSHFYLDLVFYHYILKCFVVIDLKTKKLSHQDVGQMDMYVRMFDDLKRGADDNPTIGIILCADKDETMVQYSVLKESEQLFASKYRLHLPSEEMLIAEIEREKKRLQSGKEGEV